MLDLSKMRLERFVKWLSAILLAFGLAGCAGTGGKTEGQADAPQDIVAKKAQSRWDALTKGDLDAAYEYLSAGTRSVMSLALYKAKVRPGLWRGAVVDTVACVQDRCDVVIVVEYSYRDMKSIKRSLEEVWLKDSDGWGYVPRR